MAQPSATAAPRSSPIDGMLPAVTVVLFSRRDLTLEAVRRVAWEGEPVEVAPEAGRRMEDTHAAFGRFLEIRLAEDPGALLYGVTTGPGDAGGTVLSEDARRSRP